LDGPTPIALYDTPWLYEQASASRPGVYLWTVGFNGVYVVNHVGHSETSTADAMSRHFSAFFRGEYTIYDAKAFSECRKEPVYIPGTELGDFRKQFQDVCGDLLAMLSEYTIFYAACEANRSVLEGIKATLVRRLLTGPAGVGWFLDNAPPAPTAETPMELAVRVEPWAQLVGIG